MLDISSWLSQTKMLDQKNNVGRPQKTEDYHNQKVKEARESGDRDRTIKALDARRARRSRQNKKDKTCN